MLKIYTDEDAARKHLESLLWPDGPVCPHCGCLEVSTKLKGKSTRPGVYWCNACQKPYTVTVGTLYERSHIPLHKWLYATHLLTTSKKGISAHQLWRMLDFGSYRTAWFMAHRIREGMNPADSTPPMGGEGKIVEADEMYVGKKAGKTKYPGSGGYAHKRTVMSLVERNGQARSVHLGAPTRYEMKGVLLDNTHPKTRVMTDGSQLYRFLPVAIHESVNHSKGEYVRGDVHTNTVEGFFGIFKRGMIGTYQHCSEAHLQRYLTEFDFRYSNRIALGVNDAARADIAVKGIEGRRLTYRRTLQA